MERYDVVIVGARAAGAAAALLLARAGARVLVCDRAPVIGETLSTHALMRPAVRLLSDWGVLDTFLEAGTPLVKQALFQYGETQVSVPVRESRDVPGLVAPRRALLDATLLDAARTAGAELRLGLRFERCRHDTQGRVDGAVLAASDKRSMEVTTDLLVGADGRHSAVTEAVGARTETVEAAAAGLVYGYFPDIPNQGYRWYFGRGLTAGAIPTDNGLHCLFAACRKDEMLARFGSDAAAGLTSALAGFDARLGELVRRTAPAERLRRYPGLPGHERTRVGPGWALLGDAACFKDPATAHGITDAFLDAHSFAAAVCAGNPDRYGPSRAAQTRELCAVTAEIARLDWDFDRLKVLHDRLNRCVREEDEGLDAAGVGSLERTRNDGRAA